MEPLVVERAVGGSDNFQALCLSIDLVRTALMSFTAQGGQVFFAGSDAPIDLDNPSFLPRPSLAELRGEHS